MISFINIFIDENEKLTLYFFQHLFTKALF